MAGELVKGFIGKEDFSIQKNINASETFDRTSSTGGALTMTKMPDIWEGYGKIYADLISGKKLTVADVQGDVYYHNGTQIARLAAGTSGQYLKTQGAGANPAWATFAFSTIKWLDAGVNLITWAAADVWTDVDITAYTSGETPKAAILQVEMNLTSNAGETIVVGWMRKNGSADVVYIPKLLCSANAAVNIGRNSGMFIVETDTDAIFETRLVVDAGVINTVAYYVNLIGYVT